MIVTKSDPPAKPGGPIFISHASADDAFVRQLCKTIKAWHKVRIVMITKGISS